MASDTDTAQRVFTPAALDVGLTDNPAHDILALGDFRIAQGLSFLAITAFVADTFGSQSQSQALCGQGVDLPYRHCAAI
jgi:hypothetical protein